MSITRILSVFALLAGLAFGQQGPSPLAGKIIHVYHPEPGGPLNVELMGAPYPMKVETGNWMIVTVPTTIEFHVTKFGIRSNHDQGIYWITPNGRVTANGQESFGADIFAGGNEVWIIIDPSGPTTAKADILTSAPKVVNIFNPWPTTAPVMVLSGGAKKGMLVVPGNCGWFTAFILKPADNSFFLEEVSGADAYGQQGLGSRAPYNMTTEFASKGNTLWLDTDFNSWLIADPKKNRPCSYMMAAVVRDFSKSHPDFDFGNLMGDQSVPGMVQNLLGADRKPARTTKTSTLFNNFDDWFNTKPGVNAETCVDIPMKQSDNGLWAYDSYDTPEKGFYPIDDFVNPNNQITDSSCYEPLLPANWPKTKPHNMNYCLESHATFVYRPGQKFEFRGDDDVWVFIDGKLAIDLGGIHTAKADTIILDELGLTAGKTYNWDFFYCERQPCASSLKIKTSIYFRQQRALEAKEDPAKPGTFTIIKRTGGTGACGSLAQDVVEVPATNLIYKLWNASGTELEPLGEGSFHKGGIVIATPSVVVDPEKIDDLPPGNYRVVAYEQASQSVKAEVPFTVRNRSWVQFEPNQDKRVLAGTMVPIVAANRLGDAAPTGVGAYTFTVEPGTGLQIFADQGKGTPVTVLSRSTGANGLDTIWVTGNPNAVADENYTLRIPNSQRPVTITFFLPPLILPKVVSATIHDEDENGIADRIIATYDSSIAARLPVKVAYQWPASATPVPVTGANLAGKAVGAVLSLSGQPLVTDILTSGPGVFLSTYPGRGGQEINQSFPLQEMMAPVLISAEMIPGTNADTLRLKFSESIGAITAVNRDLFMYRLNRDGVDIQYDPTAVNWSADRTGADLLFPPGADAAPRSGNLVRIMDGPGRIADAAGNAPTDKSLFRLITGPKRPAKPVEIKTVGYMKIDPTKLLTDPAPISVSLQPTDSKVEDVVANTGRLGHLIQVDLGDYARSDDFNPVNPDQVFLEYQVAYFTNHGTPVVSEKKILSCKDPLFLPDDCRTRPRHIFVGWGFTDLKRQRVATGAYISRIKFKITVAGEGRASGELDKTWGVLRSN